MHLGNEAITPECAALTLGAAAAGLSLAVIAARKESRNLDRVWLAAALSAAVFAAQRLNVPVLPHASAHLVGGVLLAWRLGPALGAFCMSLILAVQAALLGDGGLYALGANVINMALLPSGAVWVARQVMPANLAVWRQALAAGAIAAVTVFTAAALIVLEVALFRGNSAGASLGTFASQMLMSHAWIGAIEGLATASILLALGAFSPDRAGKRQTGYRLQVGVLAASMVVVACLLPLASALPDGYEAALEGASLAALLDSASLEVGWQNALQRNLEAWLPGESLLCVATACCTGLLAAGVNLACRARLVPERARERLDTQNGRQV